MKFTTLISRLFFLVLLGYQGFIGASLPEPSAPPVEGEITMPVASAPRSIEEEAEAEKNWLEFTSRFIKWDDIVRQNQMEKKFNDTLSEIKAVNIQAFHLFIEQLRKSQDEFGYISRADAEKHLNSVYKEAKFILWADIKSGKETFGGKLSHLKQKYPQDYATLEKSLQNLRKQYIDAISRDDATRLVTDTYDRVAYMRCDDIETDRSLSGKLVYIKTHNEQAYNELIQSLLKLCTNGRILKDTVEAKVYAVYVRIYGARTLAATLYYAKSFAQTTYIFMAEYAVPGVSYVFSNSYAFTKKYGSQVVEKGQKFLEQWRKKSAMVGQRRRIRQMSYRSSPTPLTAQ